MSNRLGRNPLKTPKSTKKKAEQLDKEEVEKTRPDKIQAPQAELPKTPLERLAHWLLIDIPAEGYIFGLKSILLIKTVWD